MDRKFFTEEEKRALIVCAQAGDRDAKNDLILSHQRSVHKIARKYARVNGVLDDDFAEDLFQEGCLGLVRAIEKFDTSVETTFLTYAMYWIEQKIRYAKHHNRLIQLPDHPSNWSDFTKENVARLGKCISMSAVIGHDEDESLGKLIVDDTESDAQDNAGANEEVELLRKAIACLPTRLRGIMEARAKGETLKVVGKRLGISRERIRQLESKALIVVRRLLSDRLNCDAPSSMTPLSILPERIAGPLRDFGIDVVEDLASWDTRRLMQIPMLGPRMIHTLKHRLSLCGFAGLLGSAKNIPPGLPPKSESRHDRREGFSDEDVERFLLMRARGDNDRKISAAMGAPFRGRETAHQRCQSMIDRYRPRYAKILLAQFEREFANDHWWWESVSISPGRLRRRKTSQRWQEFWQLNIVLRVDEREARRQLKTAKQRADGWHWRGLNVVFEPAPELVGVFD